MKPSLVAASLVALTFPSIPAAWAETTRVEALQRLVPQLMREGEVPGLSIVLIHDSKVSWHRAYGLANAETRAPLTNRSVFESASLTKPVFAYAVLKLADAGERSLELNPENTNATAMLQKLRGAP